MSAEGMAQRPVWGFAGFVVGTIALVVVLLQISGVFIEPDKTAAQQIGEIAAEIRKSALNALAGAPAPVQAQPQRSWDLQRMLQILAPVLAGLAAILGAIGFLRREQPMMPGSAIAMAGSVFIMQYVFWLALLIGGICLLVAIVNNIGDILGA